MGDSELRGPQQRDFVVLGGKRPDGASERARAALAAVRGETSALEGAIVDGYPWVNPPWGDPPNQALLEDFRGDLVDSLHRHGFVITTQARFDQLHWYRAAALLRQAAENATVWIEAEADHPRPDPRPAMRLQAAALRAAVAAAFDDASDPICVEPSCGRTLFAHYASGEAIIGHPFRYSEEDDELLVEPPRLGISDGDKLRVLAVWFDMWDETRFEDRQRLLDDDRNPGKNDVQSDLRRIAEIVDNLLRWMPTS